MRIGAPTSSRRCRDGTRLISSREIPGNRPPSRTSGHPSASLFLAVLPSGASAVGAVEDLTRPGSIVASASTPGAAASSTCVAASATCAPTASAAAASTTSASATLRERRGGRCEEDHSRHRSRKPEPGHCTLLEPSRLRSAADEQRARRSFGLISPQKSRWRLSFVLVPAASIPGTIDPALEVGHGPIR
jgi:hypothetical protein